MRLRLHATHAIAGRNSGSPKIRTSFKLLIQFPSASYYFELPCLICSRRGYTSSCQFTD
ncbi:hypothetical protein BDV41DRAFT_542955 [Aspergillus transmontanensis]|uniref:Uncharacterized protein n=1 Tax=Aspergillus transmontanensis TaxID=1034304 RepID=A0A5N6VRB8_9EURO|nr:hypothetical protein BDV41DRAFT_542955 [Aspergillus transmontanensis]